MTQLELQPRDPRRVDVDKVLDCKRDYIQYIGEATQMFDGTWRCLANVGGALCVVEVSITFEEPTP